MMRNSYNDTIVLRGEDSINFINSLVRPSVEEKNENNRIINKLENSISIRKTLDGFEADVSDIDLSFLEKRDIIIETEILVERKYEKPISFNGDEKINRVSVKKDNYNLVSKELISFAA